jgi:nitroreductase
MKTLFKEGKERGMVDFFDLLVKRRAIRDFEDRSVPLEKIKEIIRDSCLAPSSGNRQPWKFLIINNEEWIRRLSDESKKNILYFINQNPNSALKKYEAALRNKNFNVFYNAPCLVYIAAPKEIRSAEVDCALAACYFMFSATAAGLGTCWVDLGSQIQDPKIVAEIGLPYDCKIVAPIIVGYPKTTPSSPTRNEPQILKIIS